MWYPIILIFVLTASWFSVIASEEEQKPEMPPEVKKIVECLRVKKRDTDRLSRDFKACLKNLTATVTTVPSKEAYYPYVINKKCSEKEPFECLRKIQRDVQICLDEKLISVTNNILNFLESGWNFLCKDNNRKRAADLLADEKSNRCMIDAYSEIIVACKPKYDIEQIQLKFEFPDLFDEEHCLQAYNFKECAAQRIRKHCHITDVLRFYKELSDEMFMATDCKQFFGGNKGVTIASQISVIALALFVGIGLQTIL